MSRNTWQIFTDLKSSVVFLRHTSRNLFDDSSAHARLMLQYIFSRYKFIKGKGLLLDC